VKIKVIAIVGPTALGKSDLAVSLAKKINGEIISADSRQVYKSMDIGTGKITNREMHKVPHYMLDIAYPKRRINVADYTKLARQIILDIHNRKKIPIVCGGTGFYIEELLFPSGLPEVRANNKLREKLSKLSTEKLFLMLQKTDARRAKEIDPKNKVRIIRALEIIESLGKVPARKKVVSPFDVRFIELDAPIDFIQKRIKQRLNKRIKAGLMSEGKKLLRSGLSHKQMESFGLEYNWLSLLLAKRISRKEFTTGLENDIAQYARRQKTWFRKMLKNKKVLTLNTEKLSKKDLLYKTLDFI